MSYEIDFPHVLAHIKSANRESLATVHLNSFFLLILDCGVRPLRGQGRIVGGEKSAFGDWPWQVHRVHATKIRKEGHAFFDIVRWNN
jgi:hypothetical protein